MRRNTAKYLLLLLICTACNISNSKNKTKIIDFHYFTIEVPKQWKQIHLQAIDSYAGEIKIDSNSAIYFDLGWYCDSLDEDKAGEDYMIEKGIIYKRNNRRIINGKKVYNYKYFDKSSEANLQKVRHNYIEYTWIDGYKSKLVVSKQPKNGTTGIYIDSLWRAGDNNDKFVMSAENLNSKQQVELLRAFRSLKFYQHPNH